METENNKGFPIQAIAIPAVIATTIFLAIFGITESHRLRSYPLTTYNIPIPDDSVSIEHGRRLTHIRGCVDCHGEQMAGSILQKSLHTGLIAAPNITMGEGSAILDYSDEDLIRVIREGVRPNGKSVIIMPSHKFQVIHQRDLASLISYLRNTEPVHRTMPQSRINFPMRLYYFVNRKLALFPANLVKRPVEMPKSTPADRLTMGRYIASSCVGCHGHHLEGGPIPGAPPSWPEAPALDLDGVAGTWSKQQFKEAMTQGIAPDGRHLNEVFMPWPAFGQLTEAEYDLLWEYMQQL